MSEVVKDAARTAESSTALRVLARAGFAANGVVHLLIGAIVLVIAFGGDGETDQAGAFKAIAAVPLGFAALWLLAIGLGALGAWHVAEGILARDPGGTVPGTAKKWLVRATEWGQAAVFAALGVLAVSVALGARPDSEEAAEDASRGVLSIPGGAFVLATAGLAIAAGGVVFFVMGVQRSFERKMAIPAHGIGPAVKALGVVGFVAKGVALAIVGVLLVIAAVRVDPDAAGGLDGAIDALLILTLGPWLAGAVGLGLAAYGVFCLLRARYARL